MQRQAKAVFDSAGEKTAVPKVSYLVVNADDYGYSEGVTLGILDAAQRGIVTATGVLANSPFFDDHVDRLQKIEKLDAGVHLNLTFGRPLTTKIAGFLGGIGREFPRSAVRMLPLILTGRIDAGAIEEEWDAQIRRCQEAGLKIWFLNSHEHLHVFPPLFRVVHRLAGRYSVPYVRYPNAEWFGVKTMSGLVRELSLHSFTWINRRGSRRNALKLLGVTPSGRLNLTYLHRRLASLHPGLVHELMCHPGYNRPGDTSNRDLISYHDWEGEVEALCSAEVKTLCRFLSIRPIGYRDLSKIGH